jgi:hypothetical protein
MGIKKIASVLICTQFVLTFIPKALFSNLTFFAKKAIRTSYILQLYLKHGKSSQYA